MPKGMIPVEEDLLEQVSGGDYTGTVFVYTVRRGESIPVLAHRFGTTADTLRDLNSDVNAVVPGTKLLIPVKG